jgi:hypothetical protein
MAKKFNVIVYMETVQIIDHYFIIVYYSWLSRNYMQPSDKSHLCWSVLDNVELANN